MANPDPNLPEPPLSRVFARKVRLSSWALFFERLWPRLWLLVAIGALLLVLSLSGVFATMSAQTHALVIGLFAAAALVAAVYAGRVPWPSREEAIRRIERRSGVPHRPATSYEDTLTAYSDNPATQSLWHAHRERLARAMARLKVGRPSPRADRFDPLALRMLPLLLLVPAIGLVSGSIYDRLSSAFRFGQNTARTDTRVDAWITPPAYTGKPPIMLADGSNQAGGQVAAADKAKLFEVPIKSVLTLRGSGFGTSRISLEVNEAGADKPVTTTADLPKQKTDIAEVRYELKASSRVRALAGGEELGVWTFDVIPDQIPKITLDKDWRRTAKGSLRLAYKGEDDYGVARAVAKVKQAKDNNSTDPNKAWARPEPLKGPRLPLERPPEIVLKVPPGATKFDTASLHDLGSHPWAGQTVELWLEATDVAGQVGRSEAIELTLPSRTFRKPLARAVIEQRRKLAEDSRNRPSVVRALDALTIEPEGFIDDISVYLSMRSVYHRIERENSRAAISTAVDQLWDIALKIEDGSLSDAEQALKDARDRLAKALQEGASEEELKALMQELKEAMNRYLEEMQKNAEQDGDQNKQENDRQISKEDMEKMMRDLEESAKNGSREEAEKLLSEMQEMMENMRAGQSAQSKEQQERDREMMKKLDGLSDLTGKQQKLMDDTFSEGREQQGQQKSGGQQNGQPQGNQQGQSGQQQMGEGGNNPGRQQRQKGGKAGEDAMAGDPQKSDGHGSLMDRQSELRKKLEQLQKELDEMGAGGSDRLKDAEEAMKSAEQSLEEGSMDEAAQSQAEALEGMRESAQKMAEQLAKNARQRTGRGEDTRRDPLDRPQRAEGPDLGNSVKVPNAIDAQRAREILDELRKRSGQALRPPVELDYIDRLLKRF
ncbi:MAG: TIGR02302 family protein [Hyphomicrobium sp.]